MTVSSSTNKVSYNGNGSTTVFAYTFKIFDEDDLTVIIRDASGTETTQTITTDYTVSGVGNAGGGNVTMLTAPATGETITILREQDLVQGLDLVPNDPFPAQSLEDALDRLTFMVQQHDEELARTIKASKTNTIIGSEFTISPSDRANKIFAFDSSGNLSIAQELGTYRGDWASGTAYNQRDIVKDGGNDNLYFCNTAHTSSGSLPISSNTDIAKWDLLLDVSAFTSLYDQFDDRYLGSKASDPATDNDGNTLLDGALYWNTTDNRMKVYDLGNTTWEFTAPSPTEQTAINTVASISSDVSAVAAIDSDVTAVAADATDIGTVASNIADVNTVAGISADVSTVAAIDSDVTAVAADATDIGTVSSNIADVNTVASISADVTTVAADGTDIGTVATNISNVNTVAGISANVTTVAGISADVTTVAADGADIGTVASDITNVNTVAGISANVTTVAGISSDVTSVAADATDIGTVAGSIADVNAVADIDTDVTAVAGISSDVTSLATSIGSINALTYSDLLPIEVLHPAQFTIPRGWWDTGERLLTGASERFIISNWNVEVDLLEGTIDGVWYNITDLFTDTSGTVDVTAPGDTVRNMSDQSSGGRDVTGDNGLYATVPRPAIYSNKVSSTLTVDLPYLGNNCTIGYSTDEGVTILTGQTVGGPTEILIDRYLFGYVIVDEPISAEQTARLTQYLGALRSGYVAPTEYSGVTLLETGDALLLENDDRLDLEGVITWPLNTAA